MNVTTDKKRPLRRTAAKAEETKTLIIQAASQAFAISGFSGANLDEIADEVGVTRTAIIYHFKDKKTLYGIVLQKSILLLKEYMDDELDAEGSLLERIESALVSWIKYSHQNPTVMRLFARELLNSQDKATLRPEVREYIDPINDHMIQIVTQGQQSGEFREIAPAQFVSIMSGAMTWFILNTPLLSYGGEPNKNDQVDSFCEEIKRLVRSLLLKIHQ